MTKLPPLIVRSIQNFQPRDINYVYNKSISYSQMSTYIQCPLKWKLNYKDGKYTSQSSLILTFGTTLHEVVQEYLETYYNKSKVEADAIDLKSNFETRFRENYIKEYKKSNSHFSNSEEMAEFYDDGIKILDYLKKNKDKYFGKRGWWLVGIELPLQLNPSGGFRTIKFKGYLDIVLYHEATNKFKIIDLKTSWGTWSDKQKKDELKQNQLILYKKFFSEQFNVPLEDIEVEFLVLKRKIYENCDFPQKQFQQVIPANGKNKLNKASAMLNKFLTECFNLDGTYKEIEHNATPSKDVCKYCTFSKDKNICSKSII